MVLHVSYLVAALALMSLGNSNIRVNAADCTEDEGTYNEDSYAEIEGVVATTCGTDVCSDACQTQLTTSAGELYDCTSSSGMNYFETLTTNYACTETETTEEPTEEPVEGTCSEEDDTLTTDSIANAELGDCEETDPCEAECNAKLQNLVSELPDCTDAEGSNYYQYYLGFVDSCSSETTTEPTVTTAAPSTTTAPSTSSSTPAPATETETTSESSTGSSASTAESTTSSEASEEEATSESSASAAGSASTSKDNGAAAVGGSAIGSLVVAGTLALLAAQS